MCLSSWRSPEMPSTRHFSVARLARRRADTRSYRSPWGSPKAHFSVELGVFEKGEQRNEQREIVRLSMRKQ